LKIIGTENVRKKNNTVIWQKYLIKYDS
jgi:hypothetical protein